MQFTFVPRAEVTTAEVTCVVVKGNLANIVGVITTTNVPDFVPGIDMMMFTIEDAGSPGAGVDRFVVNFKPAEPFARCELDPFKPGSVIDTSEIEIVGDTTPPTVSVTGVTDGAIYLLGSVPTAGCSTTDDGSGVASEASVAVTGGTSNGVGVFTVTCSGAVDYAGNEAAPVSVNYTVVYDGVSGILQPINPDNTSVFSRGRAIPVKLQLAGDSSLGFDTSGWTIQAQAVSSGAFDNADGLFEDVPSNTPSTSFRYDPTTDQYIYNADMHTAPADSYWRFKVTLDSGQTLYSAVFKLK